MTDYIFSQQSNGHHITNFNPLTDTLYFGSTPAAAVTVADLGGSTAFTYNGTTVTLDNVNIGSIASTNAVFSGSILYVGDNSSSTSLDVTGVDSHASTALAGAPTVAAGNNEVLGTIGADTISFLNDTGNNVAFGGQGADNITGGLGNDKLYGGQDNDTITVATAANDTITGDNGSDNIAITSATGNSYVNGNAGNDTIAITNGVGSSIFHGGQGTDSINGGSTTGANQLFGDLGADTIVSGHGADTVSGGDGNDSITGSTGATAGQYINGNAGADTIQDGAGADTVHGGQDNDSITAYSGASGHAATLYGDAGNDTLIAGTGATATYSDTFLGGDGADSIVLTDGNAAAVSQTANGGNGADTIVDDLSTKTVAVNDLLTGGAGADVFNITLDAVSGGKATITDYATGDTVNLTSGIAYTALSAATSINSVGVTVNNGNETLVVQNSGVATIAVTNTGAVLDSIIWNNSSTAATLTAGSTNDILLSFAANDSLLGGTGADTILGYSGNDTIDAGTTSVAKDIIAGNGNDLVIIHNNQSAGTVGGGSGVDTLDIFGTAVGTYTFAPSTVHDIYGFGNIVINDTATGVDTITFLANYSTGLNGNTVNITAASTAGQDSITDGGANANVHFSITGGSHGDTITLTGETLSNTITGGTGNDSITDHAGGSLINGGIGNNTLVDTITSTGHDTITGGSGNDTIIAGIADSLSGGGGVDTYEIRTAGANEIAAIAISDFSVTGGSVLGIGLLGVLSGGTTLTNSANGAITAGNLAGAEAMVTIAQNGTSAVAAGLLKISTGSDTFDHAIGTGTLTGVSNNSELAVLWYDTVHSQAVLDEVAVGGAGITVAAGETLVEIARVGMTSGDFASLAAGNLHFF